MSAVGQRGTEPAAGSSRLVVTGNVIVDLVLTVDRLPDPGADTLASSSQITAGGAYNVMIAARRAGMDVVFAGRYGTGPMGDIVRRPSRRPESESSRPASTTWRTVTASSWSTGRPSARSSRPWAPRGG
jgi:sugar/nucleoside kinase (ribokinase family)